nr:hypothetical protein [Candidatus Baldrarchaeota archaeon]
RAKEVIDRGVPMEKVMSLPVRERIARLKIVPLDQVNEVFSKVEEQLEKEFDELLQLVPA